MQETKFKRVGDVAEVGTGKSNRQDAHEFGLYPFFIRSKEILKIDTFEFDEEAIIIPGEGGIGDIFHYVKGKYALHQRAYRIHFIKNGINTRYAYYFLQSALKKYIYTKVVCATVDSIRKPMLDDFEIPLPPLAEQERIASVLTAADNLIASLDKQIAKTRNLKQATMQRLLSSLPNHSPLKPLGEVGVTYSGLTGKCKQDFIKGSSCYITFLNVLNNPILKPELFESVHVDIDEKQNRAHKGDLFFNTSSETPEEVGVCALLNVDVDNLYLNSFCFGYRLTNKNVSPLYLSYFFRSKEGRQLMTAAAQGVTRYNLSKSTFNKMQIPIPPIEEQERIASILTAMDRQIAALEAKRSKYEMVKQGMMQQLLTGTIRLT